MTEPTPDERVWERGWKDHERRQLARLAQLPLSEKLAWLEEAHRFVRHVRGGGPTHPTGDWDQNE